MQVSRAIHWVFVLILSGSASSYAQSIDKEMTYVRDVRTKLLAQVQQLLAVRFTLHSPEFVWPVSKDVEHRLFVSLQQDVEYALISACDQDCTHVRLIVADERGAKLISTPEASPIIIVTGRFPTSGQYVIGLSVPGCKSKTCHAGLIIARQESKK